MTLCIRYARNRADAEDMLQDGFIRLYQHIHQFGFKGSFEGWVRRIFVHACLKKYQKKQWQNEYSGMETLPDHSIDPDALTRLSEQELLQLIEQLPDGYKLVFNLYVIEGYSHKEIADMLGIQEATSRTQLLKARKQLQFALEKLMIPYES